MSAIDSTRHIAASARRWSTNPVTTALAWVFATLAITLLWMGKIFLVMFVIAWDLVNLMLPRR